MQSYQTAFIELAIAHSALTFGKFTLKSGRISPYFFNAGCFYTGAALTTLGRCYAQALLDRDLSFDSLFGPAYKGIPLVCSTAIAYAELTGKPTPYTFNRKEAKDHGEGGQLVGAPLAGRVMILDDVMTAGTAVCQSIALIKAHQAQLGGVLVALDRQEKGPDGQSALVSLAASERIPVFALITLQELMIYLKDQNRTQEQQAIAAYQAEYGITP